jgi:two-component system response regulator NreC
MDKGKIRIVLADDHTVLREGIRSLLEDQPDMQVVGEAEDGRAVVQLAAELQPDVILMDIAMPRLNGLEATRQIKRDHPRICLLILTMRRCSPRPSPASSWKTTCVGTAPAAPRPPGS